MEPAVSRFPWDESGASANRRVGEDMDPLHTDVMRFMAILGFCLMAIFALVQNIPSEQAAGRSLPLASKKKPTILSPPARSSRLVRVKPSEPKGSRIAPDAETRVTVDRDATPIGIPRRTVPTDAAQTRPTAPPRVEPTISVPPEVPTVPQLRSSDTGRGFTLRFATDEVFKKLVKRGKVSLFAITAGKTFRYFGAGDVPRFRIAPAPEALHILSDRNLPSSLLRAFGGGKPATASVTWGVTLPESSRTAIRRLLRQHRGGVLVIQADSAVRLEEGQPLPHPQRPST